MRDSAAFWDGIADKYAKRPVRDPASYEKTLDCTRKYLSKTDHVLEVGCGTGSTALLLAPSVARITATDISARMVEIAREKAAAQGVENVRFERATLFDDGVPEGPFDVVVAFNLLHLLEELPGAVRRIHELLKPGGLFVSKTLCLNEKLGLWRLAIPVMRILGFAPYVHFLKVAELEETVTSAGFEILETGFYPAPNRFLVARAVPR